MTRAELRQLLEPLALRSNHIVVHASMASVEPMEGGALAVCQALMESIGENGTLVMPTFTQEETISRPVTPGTPPRSRPVAFHTDLPVTPTLGPIPEAFRRLPGVLRSQHPTHSFAAWGRAARDVLATHRDNNPLGPLKKLNVMMGHMLTMETPLSSVTAIHLAEEQATVRYLGRTTALRINAGGYEERVVVENFPGCSRAFDRLESLWNPTQVKRVALPNGEARKVSIRYLVNLATQALEGDPGFFACDDPQCVNCGRKREAARRR